MKICGIIVEYNPMTNGHLYHIQQAKKLCQPDLLVAIMSGNFTQRGEPAIVDKWQRSKAAILNGVDLVIELPFVFACESADYFAQGAIEILKALHTDTIVFGTETLTPQILDKLLEKLQTKTYQTDVEQFMKQGYSYPQATAKAFKTYDIFMPNDLLGLAYTKEIAKQQANINIMTIQRTNHYHDNIEGSSASSLRQRLHHGQSILDLSPMTCTGYLHHSEELFEPLYQKLMLTDAKALAKIHLVSEGIEARLKEKIQTATSMEDFLNKVKTRRYTSPRLLRTFVHILINDQSSPREEQHIGYIRILGASRKGQKALRQLKKQTSLPIISNFKDITHPHLDLELQVAKLYALAYPISQRQHIIQQEYATPPYLETKENV